MWWKGLSNSVLFEDTVYSERIIAWVPAVIYRFCVFFWSKLAIRHIHLKQQIPMHQKAVSFFSVIARDWLLTCD